MSTHPNVILLLTLTPDNLSRKTMRNILEEANVDVEAEEDIKIAGKEYHYKVMEVDYDDDWQISANEGDLIFFDLVTYGYGESVHWDDLDMQKDDLKRWAEDICERHNCTYKIFVTANYW